MKLFNLSELVDMKIKEIKVAIEKSYWNEYYIIPETVIFDDDTSIHIEDDDIFAFSTKIKDILSKNTDILGMIEDE